MQRLFFIGEQLESGKSLNDCNIQDGSAVALTVSNMKIKVNELDGETFELVVNLTDIAAILKARIEDERGQCEKTLLQNKLISKFKLIK